jgi:hypothetical protein
LGYQRIERAEGEDLEGKSPYLDTERNGLYRMVGVRVSLKQPLVHVGTLEYVRLRDTVS